MRYFRLSSDDEPRAQNEIDDLRWLPLEEAETFLSYAYDRALAKSLR